MKAESNFGIRRNATNFATMRFGADTDTATFTAVTESVLEPNDVRSIIAPATPDATLADVGFALAVTVPV